jgi:hypothetical protein
MSCADRGKSPEFMRATADNLVTIIHGAEHKTLAGQTHQAAAEAVVPVLVEFFEK